ncbi:GNAT family N-acetyltransferase [Anaerocolumna aminovalerica]|uniref:GNAT family N-acetyltransferase n=1 Tax=Anaerocolumna aminovalerica TaxID=1527 RepID=UPI000BE24BEC|nr:GNAT family N-acetyltransferase [Anaerocolumna aminovalerica]
MYLQGCLAESSFSQVAEKDGKIIGVIMGQAKNNYKCLSHLHNIISARYHYVAMSFQAVKYKDNIDDYKKVQNTYYQLITGKENDFDGSLTLFAVTQECRGLGVGKTLLSYPFEYLKSQNTRNIYLYTDSACNYKFYDNHGFVRLGEENLKITRENKPSTLDVFLYEYTM